MLVLPPLVIGTFLFLMARSPFARPPQSRPLHSNSDDGSSHEVTVQYDGKSCRVNVFPQETILEALEREGIWDQLPLTVVPSDCRRGNCMTCSARKLPATTPTTTTPRSNLFVMEDGLSPEMSRVVSENGYLLTCQTYVQADGLVLELAENHRLWDLVYRERINGNGPAADAAIARLLRRVAERDVPKWTQDTENMLSECGEATDIFDENESNDK